jgi:hypothetical protein
VDTRSQLADIFTKGLTIDTFATLRHMLLGWNTSAREGVLRDNEMAARLMRIFRLSSTDPRHDDPRLSAYPAVTEQTSLARTFLSDRCRAKIIENHRSSADVSEKPSLL